MGKAARKPAAPIEDVVEVFDFEQRTEPWFVVRRGIPTASRFAAVLAEGKDGADAKTRDLYMRQLAGERITGQTCETFQSDAMVRGVAMEPAIRDTYAEERMIVPQPCGFVRRTIHNPFGDPLVVGCSPDSLIGDDGLLQIKTMRPDLLIDLQDRGAQAFPSGHRAQCQGELWVTGRKWLDLRIGYAGMPIALTFRVLRDDAYIADLRKAADVFSFQLRQMVERIQPATLVQEMMP